MWRLGAQVLATDGVWEVMDCDEVARFVGAWRERPWPGWSASDALSLEAQERWKLLQPEVGRPLVMLHCQCQPTAVHVWGRQTAAWPSGSTAAGLCWLQEQLTQCA